MYIRVIATTLCHLIFKRYCESGIFRDPHPSIEHGVPTPAGGGGGEREGVPDSRPTYLYTVGMLSKH